MLEPKLIGMPRLTSRRKPSRQALAKRTLRVGLEQLEPRYLLSAAADVSAQVVPAVVGVTHFTSSMTLVAGAIPNISVVSTSDFTPSGALFVQTTNGVATVTYTGVTTTSFTGCTVVTTDPFSVGATDTTGTLDLTHPAVFQATHNTFNYTISNQTNLASGASTSISYAMFWQTATDPGTFYYLNSPNPNGSGGKFSPTTSLGVGGVLPVYTIPASGASTTISLPYMPINAGRFVFGVGTAPHLVVTASGVTTPDPNNTNSVYDFIELTMDASGADNSVPGGTRFLPTLNINTTQVDQFGFPITLTGLNNVNGSGVLTSVGVTNSTNVARDAIFSSFASLHPPGTDPYGALVIASGNPQQPYRIINPGKVPITTSMALGYVFDSALEQLFETALANLTLTSGVNQQVYTSTRTTVTATGSDGNPHTYNVLQFSGPGISPVNVYEPFFSTNAPTPASLSPVSYSGRPPKPQWLTNATETPGQMVFGNDGVFADAGLQPGLNATQIAILADLENQIVAALNRGVATAFHTTADWQNSANYYADGQVSNLYAKFLHKQAIGGTPIFIDGKAYAIGFDDQGGQNPSLVLLNQNSITATFGPWQTASNQNSDWVKAVYLSVLNRPAETVGLNYWLALLASGVPRATVSLAITNSLEARTDVIESFYTTLLHRPADPQGLNTYLNLAEAGATQAQIKSSIFGSDEYFQTRGGGTNDGFLTALFSDELNRAPSSQALAFFGQLLAEGQTRTQVANLVVGSPEAEQDQVSAFYQAYLLRPADPGGLAYWTNILQAFGNRYSLVQAGILASTEYYDRA